MKKTVFVSFAVFLHNIIAHSLTAFKDSVKRIYFIFFFIKHQQQTSFFFFLGFQFNLVKSESERRVCDMGECHRVILRSSLRLDRRITLWESVYIFD